MNADARLARGETGDMSGGRPTDPSVRQGYDACADCASRRAAPGWRRCGGCLRAYLIGLRRRRAAERRLAPLDAP
jgi:hypothetical protein